MSSAAIKEAKDAAAAEAWKARAATIVEPVDATGFGVGDTEEAAAYWNAVRENDAAYAAALQASDDECRAALGMPPFRQEEAVLAGALARYEAIRAEADRVLALARQHPDEPRRWIAAEGWAQSVIEAADLYRSHLDEAGRAAFTQKRIAEGLAWLAAH